ncbi:hypothetical protein LCGC14_0893200 [marine sediment metagenome]|uniref:Uncharacterized protein n=1 Tax=marine sediment metagenome TaxID=412755 RepID=A0A0F9PJA6_9ZZZZ
MHHTIAWFENVAQDAEADIAPVTDGQWAISNGHFFPSINYLMLCAAFISEDSVRARIRTPSFRQITTPWLRPITGTLAPGSRPGIADYRRNPLVLRALEEIEFLAEQTAIGAADIYGVACVAKTPPIEMPSGDIFTLRGTSVGVAVADTWTEIPVTWQDTLPNVRSIPLRTWNHRSSSKAVLEFGAGSQVTGCLTSKCLPRLPMLPTSVTWISFGWGNVKWMVQL